MTKFTAEEILIYLIELLLFYLEGLKEASKNGMPRDGLRRRDSQAV